ncbi:MAG: hypothetical protein V1721_09485 [Pseudomonadota bacterium]
MPKKQRISPIQLNLLLSQRLILAELLKISDILSEKPVLADYGMEVQKRMNTEARKILGVRPGKPGNENPGGTKENTEGKKKQVN